MAEVIYNEARGESLKGRLAVGQVVINRTKSMWFPDTICAVVYEPGQFSWTKDKHRRIPDAEAYRVARLVISHNHFLYRFNALYFHQVGISPGWNKRKIAVIGKHIFYS